ncbi:MAG: ABC transporter permease [Aeromonas popoffii]|uniref:ABC transporter permease n=1 Tax=Aeromonas popoffii TaxID=70856 RepID=UPI003F3BC79B
MNTPILSNQRRTSWAVLKDVTFGLLMRELKTRFGNYRMGYTWALLDPLFAISVFCVIFGLKQRHGFGGVEAPVFIAAGYLPYLMFRNTVTRLQSAVSSNRALFCYRQVTPFSTLLTRFILECVIGILVALALICGLLWFGFNALPDDPIAVLCGYSLLMLLSFSLGLIFCIATSISEEAKKIIPILMRPMLWISCVFFPLASVPKSFQHWLLWNPVMHSLELIRTGWIAGFNTQGGSWVYLASTTLILTTFAMSGYRLSHRKLIAI